MVKIKVYSDYVCPFCYFGEQILKELQEEEGGFSVEWMPFELRPFPTPTLKPEDEYLPRVWESSVYPMAESLGLEVSLPTVSPQPYTHFAFEGYQFAKEQEKGEEYSNRVFEAFFKEDKDIGNIDVLTELEWRGVLCGRGPGKGKSAGYKRPEYKFCRYRIRSG